MADSHIHDILSRIAKSQEPYVEFEDRTSDDHNTSEDFRVLETAVLKSSPDDQDASTYDDLRYTDMQRDYSCDSTYTN